MSINKPEDKTGSEDQAARTIRPEFMQAAREILWTKTLKGVGAGVGTGVAVFFVLDLLLINISGNSLAAYGFVAALGATIGGGFGLEKGAKAKAKIIENEIERANKVDNPAGPTPAPGS